MSQAKKCVKCKYTFIANEGWESTCIVCWKESKEMDLLKGDKQVRLLQKELAHRNHELKMLKMKQTSMEHRVLKLKDDKRKSKLPLDNRLRDLLMLCHPDKHKNSEKSSDVTRWLLEIRKDRSKST